MSYYAAATGDVTSKNNAKEILDRIWNNYKDAKGVSAPETRSDYSRAFTQEVYIPSTFAGKMPNGDVIKSGDKFLDIRSQYKNDPDYARVKAAVDAGTAPVFNYHRFWAQSEFAIANGTYATLFPVPGITKGDLNGDGKIDKTDCELMKKYIINNLAVIDKTAADMNNYGKINILDSIQLDKLTK